MSYFDIALVLIVAAFALFGLWFGFVHTLGSLLGTILGVFLASRYYTILGDWFVSFFDWEGNGPRVFAFILSFLIINRVVGFVFWLIEKFFHIFTALPFVKSLNRLLGFVVGIAEGLLTIGISIYFIHRFPLSDTVMNWIASSQIAPTAEHVASVFLPILPQALKLLNATVEYVETAL